MPEVQLTWLGHASFRFDSPGGKRVYVDPFFDNPLCPEEEKQPGRIDVLALTHGHSGLSKNGSTYTRFPAGESNRNDAWPSQVS